MLDDTAASSTVTSSRDSCHSDITDDSHPPAAVSHEDTVTTEQVSAAGETVDVTSTSSAAGTDTGSVQDRSRSGQKSECRVCGDEAAGMYFGALVCVPCKVGPDQ